MDAYHPTVVLLIAQPGDELIGTCAVTTRARAAGMRVLGVYLTTGIGETSLRRRHAEHAAVSKKRALAANVAAALGIEPVLWQDIECGRLKSHIEKTVDALRELVTARAINTMWVPAYAGGHPDQDVANFIGSIFAQTGTRVFEYAEYQCACGRLAWQQFIEPDGSESTLLLDAAEAACKQRLLKAYPGGFAAPGHVEMHAERMRPLAAYDYARPPHTGRVCYQRARRFPWLPRLRACRPREVCAAMIEYLARAHADERTRPGAAAGTDSTRLVPSSGSRQTPGTRIGMTRRH